MNQNNTTNNTSAEVNIVLQVNTILVTLSIFGFLIPCLILIFRYIRGQNGQHFSHHRNLILLLFGMFSATITPLSVCQVEPKKYYIYLMIVLAFVGFFVYIVGCIIFFEISDQKKSMSHDHPDISLIIWVVAIPLVILEVFETIIAVKYHNGIDIYFAGVKGIGFVQKLGQASMYHFSLRLKVPHRNHKEGAGMFLMIMSLFNYAMWLDSIMTAHNGNKYIVEVFGNGLSIVSTACDALLIDYRLLCCLLFAEHALDMKEDENQTIENANETDDDTLMGESSRSNKYIVSVTQMSGFGYLVGIICLGLQLIGGLQYANLVPHWVNIFPILADIMVVVFGVLFTRLSEQEDNEDQKWGKTSSKAIDIMVAVMGVIGFLFWLTKSAINILWISQDTGNEKISGNIPYLAWSAVKNSVRTCGILFQMFIFMRSDPLIGCRDAIRINKLNFFLLPALMLSLLSVFSMTIIDSFSGLVESLIEEANLGITLATLFKAGEPIHLGFCLHVFLHFLIINSNMRNFRRNKEIQKRVARSYTRSRKKCMTPISHRDDDKNVDDVDDSNHVDSLRQRLIDK